MPVCLYVSKWYTCGRAITLYGMESHWLPVSNRLQRRQRRPRPWRDQSASHGRPLSCATASSRASTFLYQPTLPALRSASASSCFPFGLFTFPFDVHRGHPPPALVHFVAVRLWTKFSLDLSRRRRSRDQAFCDEADGGCSARVRCVCVIRVEDIRTGVR